MKYNTKPLPVKYPEKAEFPLGVLNITNDIVDIITCNDGMVKTIEHCLYRHANRDYGDIPQAEKDQNDYAVSTCLGIISEYQINNRVRIRIATNAYPRGTEISIKELK